MSVAFPASKDAKRGTTISDAPTVPAPTALETSLVPNAVKPAVSTFFTLSAKTSSSGITLSGKFSTIKLAAIPGSKPVAAPLPKFLKCVIFALCMTGFTDISSPTTFGTETL